MSKQIAFCHTTFFLRNTNTHTPPQHKTSNNLLKPITIVSTLQLMPLIQANVVLPPIFQE